MKYLHNFYSLLIVQLIYLAALLSKDSSAQINKTLIIHYDLKAKELFHNLAYLYTVCIVRT